ncbi:sugar porter family MFS transporter [Maricaulis maris]|uniref:SP family sugar:H+ symporter-like MFS transporter n=1 Tax=Maricaulis maris TaxID=74318 RepID=A0A495D5S3_9PROT|nr:sugar porter family MFS transporter [Maricaulis maris]RKQ96508.1 SP family sugar:H+ symporter-like MFS transporter [Maricaulis maris]
MTDTADSAVSTSAPAEAPNMGYILAIAIVATIGGFLFGYDSGVINGTVDGLRAAFNSEDIGTGWNVASMLLGCAIGALIAGRAADIFGRRTLLVAAAIFFIVSAWGSGMANGSTEFVIYRLLGGLAVGAASVMAPAYISEIAPAAIRGRLATIQQIAIIAGLFFSFLSNYLLAETAGGSTVEFWLGFETWRWMFWMELLPAVIFLIALFSIPESPRFLVFKKKNEQATGVLTKLFGPVTAKRKVGEIESSLAADHQPSLRDLISPITKKIRPIVWVGIGLASFQQLVGINIIFYYGAVLWQAAGFTESDALLTNVLSGALSIGSVIVALLVIDKLGRKPMLIIGSIGMAVTLGLCAFAFSTGELIEGSLSLSDNMALLALVAANVYVMFFNFSWGPVMWVMLGEMFPNQMRGSGLAIAGLFQWGTNFLISITFLSLLSSIGLAGAYGIYTVFAVISIWFVIKMVRETRGKELEDMEG